MTKSYLQPLLGCSLTALTALLASHGAYAQSAPTKPSDQIQEVVITAQKKTENLQRASIAVDVLKPGDIAKQGIKNAVDLQQLLPAVKFIAGSVMTVEIRGLGTSDLNTGVDSAVAYSQDGIYLSHPSALAPVLFDLQRVEAVLGPQGTLYGRNSNGGVINFISNDPVDKYAGMASVGFGNYGAVNSEAMINIPLTDELALRVAEGSEKHNPYTSDGYNNVDSVAGRMKLLYTPNSDLKALLTVDASQRISTGQGYGAICPPNTQDGACAGVPYTPWSGLLPAAQGEFNHDFIFGASGKLDYNFGWAQLTSLTGFKTYHFSANVEAPWYGGVSSFAFLQHEGDKFFTQEIRLASEPDSKISWVGGIYYSDENETGNQQTFYDATILQAALGVPTGYYQAYPVTAYNDQSEAVFGAATVPLLDGLRFRGGLRYTHETKTSAGDILTGVVNGTPGEMCGALGPCATAAPTGFSESQSRVTWNVGLDYDITPKNLAYVTASTGFKSGGINNLPALAGNYSSYAPETILAEEIGTKNRFFDDRLQINADVFHYSYNGYQVVEFWQPNGNPAAGPVAPAGLAGATLFPTINAKTATFEGGELNMLARLTPVDTLGFNVNLLADNFNNFIVALPYTTAVNFSGAQVANAPKATYSMNYEHTFMMPNGDSLNIGANSDVVMSHRTDGTYNNSAHVATLYYQPTYHETGVNVNYETAESGWTVSAYIRNIENVAVVNSVGSGYPALANIAQVNVQLDQPRTFGFNVKKVF